MERRNCWEAKACGREPGGARADELGVCPAAVPDVRNGVNQGQFGGRFCWAVAGTLCGGRVQGTLAAKLRNCLECEFLQQVHEEQGASFTLMPRDASKPTVE